MECGVSAGYPSSGAPNGGIMADVRSERSPAKSGLHVNFSDKGEVKERREKFLTAKYGSHQMSLIRKRLAVEMWLYDELQKLYETTENSKTREVEVDIDELLDMDSDDQRRRHLQELLADAKKSPHDVKKFVEDLLERAKTL
ncbi:protein phosphatase 1 regulatory subunit 14B isoform X2 [Anabrus simplex]